MQIKYLPTNLLKLREVLLRQHLDIVNKIDLNADLPTTLGEIANELGIAVDGMYDVDDFCEMLLWELENKTRREQGLPTKMRYRGLKMIETQIDLEITQKLDEKPEPDFAAGIPSIGEEHLKNGQ